MLKEISELSKKFGNVEEVKKELKRVQSIKCRLRKQKAKKTYEEEMSKVVTYEQSLKEVKMIFEPKKTTVTTMSEEDIKELTYDEVVKAIKSIQSKKCNTQYLTENIEDNVEYQEALRIENMLKEHRKTVQPIENNVVKKSKINDLIENLSNLEEKVDKEYVLKMLQELKQD